MNSYEDEVIAERDAEIHADLAQATAEHRADRAANKSGIWCQDCGTYMCDYSGPQRTFSCDDCLEAIRRRKAKGGKR